MTSDGRGVRDFLETYNVSAVGPTPPQPLLPPDPDETGGPDAKAKTVIDRAVERDEAEWEPLTVPEQPAKPGEFPERFIDGSQASLPILCVRAGERGYPVPILLGEVGAVALRLEGRGFRREFCAVERVLAFVADPFPWQDLEAFAADLLNSPELTLRILPANRPKEPHNPYDYEIMRVQAYSRVMQEMANLEKLALAAGDRVPTLVDGQLHRVTGEPPRGAPLLVGVVKRQAGNYLHDRGWQALLDLRPAQRTPVVRIDMPGNLPVATWFLKLAGGPRLAPNWGHVRVEIPWSQYVAVPEPQRTGFVHRLSRWLIDARCRADSYARMPVSLDPIVRAEESIKPLFTPLPLLATRLYRTAGLFRRNER
jgi:hypothetical protein